MSKKKIILVINCPDKAGIISSVSTFLFKNKFNILESSQYKDSKNNQFFMRVCFTILPACTLHDPCCCKPWRDRMGYRLCLA